MAIHEFLIGLALILIVARVLAEVAARLGIPSVIGELFAGVLLGPSVFNLVEPTTTVMALAEVGLIMLLFEVGLHTDIDRLARSGGKAIVVALGGFVFPFILTFGLCRYIFQLDLLPSLLIGGTMTATSIGITVRILADVGRQNSREGQIVLGAAVLDDILGVVLLAVLYDFSRSGQVSLANLGQVFLFIGVFFLIAPGLAKAVSAMTRRVARFSEVPGLIPVTMVSLMLVFAWLAHFLHVPELLGGFAAGLALSRRFFLPFGIALRADPQFADEVGREIKPIIQLFTPIFFVTVGMSLDLSSVDWTSATFWVFSLSLLAVAVAGKFGGAIFIRESPYVRVAIGMCMVARGEVGLVFSKLGLSTGMIDEETYAVLVIVIAYTTLFAPFWIKLYYRVFRKQIEARDGSAPDIESVEPEPGPGRHD